MAHEIRHITLNGAQLGYSVHGAGPDKPSLVFAHGYAMRSTGRLYAELLDLPARRFAVSTLDFRGHGASAGAVAGWSFEATADDVIAFSRALGLDDPVFFEHSFGAVIGLLAEICHSGTFLALGLLPPDPADHRRDPVNALDALIERGRDQDMLRDGFRRMSVRQPGGIRAGFPCYRAIYQDANENHPSGARLMPLPVLAIGVERTASIWARSSCGRWQTTGRPWSCRTADTEP